MRKLYRLIALVAVVGAFSFFLTGTASAHHPEIKASASCVDEAPLVSWTATSWKTNGGSGSGNSKVEVYRNGSKIATGAFTNGNGYSFSGSFDASAYEGQTLTIKTKAINRWSNGTNGGQQRSTTVTVPTDCEPPPTTTTTVVTTTTTEPVVTTTIPEVTTTLPEVTTTLPDVTTTLPDVPPTTELPTQVCTGEGDAEVCTSSVTLVLPQAVAEPAEAVVAEPQFTG